MLFRRRENPRVLGALQAVAVAARELAPLGTLLSQAHPAALRDALRRSPWARRSARAISITPFIGFHLIITFALAWLLRGNMIAGVIAGTCFGNPVTYPFIWASTYQLGR